MTKEDCRKLASLAPALLAYAEGKKIQFKDKLRPDWTDCDLWIHNTYSLTELLDDTVSLRIKPEPKLRAWRAFEFPIGAAFKRASLEFPELVFMIGVAASVKGARLQDLSSVGIFCEYDKLLELYTHSTDGGITWRECGVETTE